MSEDEVQCFGIRVRQARINAGLSQEAMAEKVGVSARTIINWESGVNYPELSRLPSIARATQTQEYWFFIREDATPATAPSLAALDQKLDLILEVLKQQSEVLARLAHQ